MPLIVPHWPLLASISSMALRKLAVRHREASPLTPEPPVRRPCLFIWPARGLKGEFVEGLFQKFQNLADSCLKNDILKRDKFGTRGLGEFIVYYYLGGYLLVVDEVEAV